MSRTLQPSPAERARGALAAGAVAGVVGYALILGLGVHPVHIVQDGLKLFAIPPERVPPPKPPVVQPPHARAHRKEAAAAPPNLRSHATDIVVPPAIVPPVVRSPVTVAPVANTGMQASQGAAEVAGPGTGAGGQGNGTGSGGQGDGDGDGDGDNSPPRLIKGHLKIKDVPQELIAGGRGGTVSVIYAVETDGRVTDCQVSRSSGLPDLDALTCRLIEQRFRYEPSRDPEGHPVRSHVYENHSWEFDTGPDVER